MPYPRILALCEMQTASSRISEGEKKIKTADSPSPGREHIGLTQLVSKQVQKKETEFKLLNIEKLALLVQRSFLAAGTM